MFELNTQKEANYHFTLKAKNGQVILSSETYTTKAGAKNGILAIKKNVSLDNRYERKTAKNGKFYFNLKASNGQVIGSSQMYSSESGMENGIKSVKENTIDAEIKEI